MKQLQWISLSIFVLALLLGSEAVNAYMMYGSQYNQPYYPSRNYYMMDYYYRSSYGYYDPYQYSYGYPTSRGFFTNYYNDPNWKYYTLNSFMRGPQYGNFY